MFSVLFSACTQGGKTGGSATKELRIFTWSNYIEDSFIKEFEAKTGARVKLDYFSSNEELLTKIRASVESGSAGYDLIMPSDYMVHNMIQLGLLQSLDHAQLAFIKDFSKEFQNPEYDPGLKFSVPVAWGTTGVAVETSMVKSFNEKGGISWKELFESKENKGQVALLDDMKEVFHAALLVLGKSWKEATADDVKAAFEYIKKHRANIKAFSSEAKPVMEAGECHYCQAYSGDVLRAKEKRKALSYFIPKEGATLWTDNFAIPKNAQNPSLSHAFLAHFLSAESAKTFTELTFFASPSESARALLPEALKNDPVIFPSTEARARLHLIKENPDLLILMDQYWTELRSE